MLNLISAAFNGGVAVYISLGLRKAWKHIPTGLRVLNVTFVALNVLCCAMNLVCVFAG